MSKYIEVIINPASGQDQPILNIINDVFQTYGVRWGISVTRADGDAYRFAKTAVAKGADVVAAYGGDGTVMEVARGLIESGIPLAILPGGTANLMSVELGIPKKLATAAAIACDDSSIVRAIDMGKANGHHFMLRVGIGFPAEKVILADRHLKNKYGLAAYTIAAIKAIDTSKISHYQLTLDGNQVEIDGIACRIDNSSNIGMPHVSIWPESDVSDGYLDVLVWKDIDIKTFYAGLVSIDDPERTKSAFHHWRAREITIETKQPQAVQGDGEVWGDTPISIQVVPSAMHVLVSNATVTN